MEELFTAFLYHIRQESFWWGFAFGIALLIISTVAGGALGRLWAGVLQFRAKVPAVKLPGERPSGCQRMFTCLGSLVGLVLLFPVVFVVFVFILLLFYYALFGEWPRWLEELLWGVRR